MSTEQTMEDGWFATTFERKYYQKGQVFIKRCLKPTEFRTGYRGLHVPRFRKESLQNEADSLRYIQQHTDIPVPKVLCDFEDDDTYYLVTEYIDGVQMSDLAETQKSIVRCELESQLGKLRTLKSNRMGGPSGIVIPPHRVQRLTKLDTWCLIPSDRPEFVFCHNDLSQQNVIVDPVTFKINAIIDWEYAGFYPSHFERAFYTRFGPSSALEGEIDDSGDLLKYLESKLDQQKG